MDTAQPNSELTQRARHSVIRTCFPMRATRPKSSWPMELPGSIKLWRVFILEYSMFEALLFSTSEPAARSIVVTPHSTRVAPPCSTRMHILIELSVRRGMRRGARFQHRVPEKKGNLEHSGGVSASRTATRRTPSPRSLTIRALQGCNGSAAAKRCECVYDVC